MGSQERRERERQETRSKILDAARELFATRGIEATTMRAIAERIEYTPTAIYHHFRDKDELILELVYSDFRSLFQAFARIGHIEDPVERLGAIGMAYVEFGLEHPHHYQIMFMTPKSVTVEKNPEENAYEFLRATVAEAVVADRFRPELRDVEELAQILWAAVHGVVSLPIAKKENADWIEWRDTREKARTMIDVMFRGLLRSPAT